MDLHEQSARSAKISPDFQLTRRGLIRFNRDSRRARRPLPQGVVLKGRSERQLRVSVGELPMSTLLLFEGERQTLQSSIYRHDKRFLDSDATLFFFFSAHEIEVPRSGKFLYTGLETARISRSAYRISTEPATEDTVQF